MAVEISFSEAFKKVVEILNDKSLGWIVEQVEEQIRLGKPVSRHVKELKAKRRSVETAELFRIDALAPGRAVEFRATVDFTDAEKLELLLSAIHQAIVSTSQMEKVVTKHFPGFVFTPENNGHKFSINQLDRKKWLRTAAQLQHAIENLKSHLG